MKLKELKGSQKQISWAEDIRKELVDTINYIEENNYKERQQKELLENAPSEKSRIKREKRLNNEWEKLISEITENENAKWFIENFKNINNKNTISGKIKYIAYKAGRSNLRIIKVWQKYLEKIANKIMNEK